jgi:hypothetical protein
MSKPKGSHYSAFRPHSRKTIVLKSINQQSRGAGNPRKAYEIRGGLFRNLFDNVCKVIVTVSAFFLTLLNAHVDYIHIRSMNVKF